MAGKRAKNGSDEARLMVRMSAKLREDSQRAARALGISEAAWWRSAGEHLLTGMLRAERPKGKRAA